PRQTELQCRWCKDFTRSAGLFSHSLDPKQTYMTDRYQKGAYADPHKTRDTWSHRLNSLKRQRARRILHEQ
ncbi:MAG: hypothetical protein AABY61_02685, partial [Nitrospirota bacterium]